MKREWKKPKVIYRGMCPSMKEYPNELSISYNEDYFEKNYKTAGWKIAPDDMIESLKKKPNKEYKIKVKIDKTVDEKAKLLKQLLESDRKLALANGTVCKQINELESIREYVEDLEKSNRGLEAFIQTQEKHLRIAEKAIERKDKQFYGIRAAYQDEIINRGE